MCDGLSPCDAYDYDRNLDGTPDGIVGVPGFCFLPPTVDNHLSDPACSGAFVPGLDGIFKLAWCQVDYPGDYPNLDGTQPPTVARCQDPSQWADLIQDPNGGAFYVASVQWKKKDAAVGDVFRLYVVHGDLHFAHRDVVIDPNLTMPADAFVHAIGYGTEPVKVRITQGFSCVYYDTQLAGTDNAATCLVDGASTFTFTTNEVTTTFNFPDGNPTFLANFEVSECLSLGFHIDPATSAPSGNALVDTPLGDCKISLSSEQIQELPIPGQIQITSNDPRWDQALTDAPFRYARLNVIEADEAGVSTLPPSTPPSPNWFGTVTGSSTVLRWLGEGIEKLASLIFPGSVTAQFPPSAGWDFTRMSDFQVSVMPVVDFDESGGICGTPSPSCLDLGSFTGDAPVPVHVKVSAPDKTGPHTYPDGYIAVPDTRLHFFPGSGTVSCPAGSEPSAGTSWRGCYPAGADDNSTTPASHWDHLVYVTGTDGKASVAWSLASGDNTMNVSACGVARPGANEPDPPGEPGSDGVWGTLGDCSNRELSMTQPGAYDNGPADGFTPFEPVDVQNEVAIYGLPLTFQAHTCPPITIDGREGDVFGTPEWEVCAQRTAFSAPLKGPKGAINAWLYTYNDAAAVYVALKVKTDALGNKAFINFVENDQDVQAAGDELLDLDLGDSSVPLDWHFTQSCVENSAATLCGDPDQVGDGPYGASAEAKVDGAGSGFVFYEFKRPLGSPNAAAGSGKEDLAAAKGDVRGLRITVTQGSGGGKGGFVYPDPQTSPVVFHLFTIK
ncbi:MAG: hypothetical protein LJF04_06215 [Gemmatimonadetes bacterium]|nr:hypothetical protein [Gemmatimonadota bacterium]